MAEWQSIIFVRYSAKLEPRNTRKLHNVFNSESAVLAIQCALQAARPRLLTLRRLCHYCSAELPTHRLIKLQFRDRLCMRTSISHQPIMPGFRCQVCRLIKLKFGDSLYCFWSSQLLCIRLHRW